MRFDNARISQLKSADLFPLLDGLVSAGIGCELSIIRYAWRGASPELLVNWVDNSGVDWHCLHTNQSRRQLIASKTHSCSATIRWISLFGTVYLFLIRIERILCYKTKTRHFQTVTMLSPPPPPATIDLWVPSMPRTTARGCHTRLGALVNQTGAILALSTERIIPFVFVFFL